MHKLSLFKLSLLLGLGLMLANPSLAMAQDESTEKKQSNLEMTIELYSTIMAKTFEKAKVDDSQMEKIKEVIDRCIPKLVTTRNEMEGILTAEQKKLYGAAVRQALNAKYSQEEAEAFALRKLKLAKDVQEKYVRLKSEVAEINKTMNSEIEGLLTDEQKASLPMFAGKGPKVDVHKVKFPAMKTDEDGKKVEDLVKSIKGAKISQMDLAAQVVRIELPKGTSLNAELEKLIKADNKILEGWERVKVGTAFRKGPPGTKITPGSAKPGSGSK